MGETINNSVVFVCHCILNQSTRAWWGTGGASRVERHMKDLLTTLDRYGVGLIQMECPEYSLYGNPRPPKSKDDYDTPVFKERCREIAEEAVQKILEFKSRRAVYPVNVLAILWMEGSPSCGVERTSRTVEAGTISTKGRGHLMDVLAGLLLENGLDVPLLGMSLREGEGGRQIKRLDRLLHDSTLQTSQSSGP